MMDMKYLLSGALIILIAAAVFSHKTYKVERIINAPPEVVWDVLMDTASYGDWNPVFIKVVGSYEQGGSVQNTFQAPSGETFDVTNRVTELVPQKLLRQKGGMTGIITFDHQWQLQPVEGGTRVTQYEIDRGIYVWFWDDSWIIPSYTKTLDALAEHVAEQVKTSDRQ